MSHVVIVSNRLPISVKKDKGKLVFSPSLGGLATGLSSLVKKGSKNLWIGWPGIASDDLNSTEKQTIATELSKQNYIPVFLSQKQIDNFYNGYSNSVLWPLFHDLPVSPVDPGTKEKRWNAYQNVNKRFCETVLNNVGNNYQIWIHDYQLLLLPQMLRLAKKDANLGFFLHIPFPNPKQFYSTKEAPELLKGMLGADLVGFHTTSYVEAFLKSAEQKNIKEVQPHQLQLTDRVVRVAEFPMGIDYEKFAEANKSKVVKEIVKDYKSKYKKLKIIASVDRLDPSKGLTERLNAYRDFLSKYPNMQEKVVFVMVAAPSRTDIAEYKKLSKRLDKLSKTINAQFGTTVWQPVDYINVPVPFESVTALFQIADVAFIAPIRDGMNLAAKEFVASNKRGVLILSETAGAAEELGDAIIVNPKKPETLVDALDKSLNMRRRELTKRLSNMRQYLSTHTVNNWATSFMNALQQPVPGTPRITYTLNPNRQKKLIHDYETSQKRLLLLDYDGSLVPFNKDYKLSKPPHSLLNLLNSLTAINSNEVVLISGRPSLDLEKWFGALPINLVAEHGAAIKTKHQAWESIEDIETDWKLFILPALEKYAQLTPGAKIEVKPHSLVWHYRSVSPYYAQKYTVIIKRALRPILKKYKLEILQGNKVLEIKNPKVSKGNAAERWLNSDYDFVFGVGDDVTDEELFSVLPINAYSLKVGKGLTKARNRVSSYKDVIKLLKKMV